MSPNPLTNFTHLEQQVSPNEGGDVSGMAVTIALAKASEIALVALVIEILSSCFTPKSSDK
jgi:hypothetical protein